MTWFTLPILARFSISNTPVSGWLLYEQVGAGEARSQVARSAISLQTKTPLPGALLLLLPTDEEILSWCCLQLGTADASLAVITGKLRHYYKPEFKLLLSVVETPVRNLH